MTPRVQYATADDGTAIAFTSTGDGPPLVYLQPHSHVAREWEFPETAEWYGRLSQDYRLIRFDLRCFGLSQRGNGPITMESCLADTDAVVRALRLEQFDLLGVRGLSAVAATYAALHPESVHRLVMWSPATTMRSWFGEHDSRADRQRAIQMLRSVEPALMMELLARFVFGDAVTQPQKEFLEAAVTPEDFSSYDDFLWGMDVTETLPRVAAPTLVVHSRNAVYMTLDNSAAIAALIPGAQLADVESGMYPYMGLSHARNFEVLDRFLRPTSEGRTSPSSESLGLSARELSVLALVARGYTNREIAEELTISQPTVASHIVHIYTKTGARNRAEATARYFGG